MPVPQPGQVYTRAGLRRMGISERRIGSPEFRRVLPGRYASAQEPVELRSVARAVIRRAVPGGVISHVTAAELLRLPLPEALTWAGGAAVHCTVAPERKRRSARGLIVHVRSGRRSIPFHGLELEHPVGVLLDLAGLLDHDDLVACIDALGSFRREDMGITVDAVREMARGVSGRGIRALRAAARDARDGVDSPRETRTRLMLLRAGYPEPEINRPVVDPATGKEYAIDLAYRRWMVAIEYDGKDHLTAAQQRKDHAKDEVLHAQGWSVLRLTSDDHHDSSDFFRRLEFMIADAEARGDRDHRAPGGPGDTGSDAARR